MLTEKAEKKEKVAEDATYHNLESYCWKYVCSMTLPYHVNRDKASATLENGTLELRLAKAGEIEAKRIEVKAKLP